MNESNPIGYIVDGKRVICGFCADAGILSETQPVKLYRENIYPYRQTCHNCGGCMCEGQTESWPELFSNPDTTETASHCDCYGLGCSDCMPEYGPAD